MYMSKLLWDDGRQRPIFLEFISPKPTWVTEQGLGDICDAEEISL